MHDFAHRISAIHLLIWSATFIQSQNKLRPQFRCGRRNPSPELFNETLNHTIDGAVGEAAWTYGCAVDMHRGGLLTDQEFAEVKKEWRDLDVVLRDLPCSQAERATRLAKGAEAEAARLFGPDGPCVRAARLERAARMLGGEWFAQATRCTGKIQE